MTFRRQHVLPPVFAALATACLLAAPGARAEGGAADTSSATPVPRSRPVSVAPT